MRPLAEVTPGGVQTYSKSPERFAPGCPALLTSGFGCRVQADDGREFIDYVSALGAVILGYRDRDVDAAVHRQIAHGMSFSLPTRLEGEVAEQVIDLFPGVEMVRFQKNGKDACDAAVRIARAVTDRDRVVTIGYHGGSDWTMADTNSAGIPQFNRDVLARIPYGDSAAVARELAHGDVACLIMEPVVATSPILPPLGYLGACRELCTKHGALLIFDEVVTGFRFEGYSAAKHYGVTPDIYAAGKAMGNGMPLSIVAGPREIMKLLAEGVFCSTTFGGETLSLAAARATIEKLQDCHVPDRLAEYGLKLMAGYQAIAEHHGLTNETHMIGYASRPVIVWLRNDFRTIFETTMIAQGILMQGYHNLTLAHTLDVQCLEWTLAAYDVALGRVAARLAQAA